MNVHQTKEYITKTLGGREVEMGQYAKTFALSESASITVFYDQDGWVSIIQTTGPDDFSPCYYDIDYSKPVPEQIAQAAIHVLFQ